MDKSKLNTLWWKVSLAVMMLTVGIVAVAEVVANMAGVLIPNMLVNVCGFVSFIALVSFAFALFKKLEERNEDMY